LVSKKTPKSKTSISADAQRLISATHHDPFSYLGQHQSGKSYVQRVYYPNAVRVSIKSGKQWKAMTAGEVDGLFESKTKQAVSIPYQLKVETHDETYQTYDTYCFESSVSDVDLHLFAEGQLKQAYQTFGAHLMTLQKVGYGRYSFQA